uniref:Uncharacterized protein n=1 Tax=Lotharella oceanica TaxID=641309 RepID=A0A7S2XB86_9EUKA|mmetsp:Transcript_25459/g.47505  ORF Transcript_25459/g.47505 Transcript_25459/m.47505 type:complete len:268 (+) Transcript_25459:110-913(+)
MGQGQHFSFEKLEVKVAASSSPGHGRMPPALSGAQLEELFQAYSRPSKPCIGRSRAQDFARDLVAWHKAKGNIKTGGRQLDVAREVFRVLNVFALDSTGRIYLPTLKTTVASEVLLRYRFPRNRKQTEHVVQAMLSESMEHRVVDIIVSYTSDWGFHKGQYIGYGARNGFWKNGWGYKTFIKADPHPSHAPSHSKKGDGLSHWTCCGCVDQSDSFCIWNPPPPASERRSRRTSPYSPDSGGSGRRDHAGAPQVTPSSRNNNGAGRAW